MLSIPHPCPLLNLQLPNSDILQHPQIDRNARLFVHQDILHQPTQIRPQSAAAFLAEPVRILPSAGEVSYQIFLIPCLPLQIPHFRMTGQDAFSLAMRAVALDRGVNSFTLRFAFEQGRGEFDGELDGGAVTL